MTILRDQHGDPVPNDLVVLDLVPADLYAPELARVVACAWYEVNGVLLASFEELGGLIETNPVDVGIDLDAPGTEVLFVARSLHRWDEEHFYHA